MKDLDASLLQKMKEPFLSDPFKLSEESFFKNLVNISLFTDHSRGDLFQALDQGHSHGQPQRQSEVQSKTNTGDSLDSIYWADSLSQPLGSKLWKLSRSSLGEESLEDAIQYTQEALAWMLDEGLVLKIEVDAKLLSAGKLILCIALTTPEKTHHFSLNPKEDYAIY